MARPGQVRLVLYDSRINGVDSHIKDWAYRLERRFTNEAERAAPVRSGDLRAGIYGEAVYLGRGHWNMEVHSTAPHSLFVLMGTKMVAPITPTRETHIIKRGRFQGEEVPAMLAVGKQRLYPAWYGKAATFGFQLMASVAGQRKNNFLRTAHRRTARRHPSIAGMSWNDLGTGI